MKKLTPPQGRHSSAEEILVEQESIFEPRPQLQRVPATQPQPPSPAATNASIKSQAETILEMPKSTRVGLENVKNLPSFKKIKKSYKLKTQKDVFVTDVKALLSHLDATEHEYDLELLLSMLNACESYFIYGNKREREESKREALIELMGPFFKDNVQILDRFSSVLKGRVKKSNIVRRVGKRLSNFFCSIIRL
jgi:hypothetical protein